MLKIKDNVDLKKLEKFGLIRTTEDDGHIDWYELNVENESEYLYIMVSLYDKEIFGNYLDKLYDLIKADLVEKVEV